MNDRRWIHRPIYLEAPMKNRSTNHTYFHRPSSTPQMQLLPAMKRKSALGKKGI